MLCDKKREPAPLPQVAERKHGSPQRRMGRGMDPAQSGQLLIATDDIVRQKGCPAFGRSETGIPTWIKMERQDGLKNK